MRTYLVVADDTPEASVALRFAAQRAARSCGALEIVAIIAPTEFVASSAVQATIEEEARQHADALIADAATLARGAGITPSARIETGEAIAVVRSVIAQADIAMLVLGAAIDGMPGPLVAHFASGAGSLPCPVMIVPGALSDSAIERLS